MVYVYYTAISEKLEGYKFNELLEQVPLQIQSKVLKYRKWQDRQRGLLGKLLLQKGLEWLGEEGFTLSDLKYNIYDRPYFNESIDFNISHSGDYVVCAISKSLRIGVDIEEIQEIPISDFDLQFSKRELTQIGNSSDRFREFFTFWTKKEAFLKAIGIGLNSPLNQLEVYNNEILWEGKKWFLQNLQVDDKYVSHLCTDAIFPKIELRNLRFD